jgi:MerR family transcriptional regulator, copper efflux regulator
VRTLLRIGELAKRTAKTVRALHLYEERGLLSPPERTQGGFRLYDEDNVTRILYIDRLQRLGYSLTEIAKLVNEWEGGGNPREAMANVEAIYRARLTAVGTQITELRALQSDLEASLTFLVGCHTCDSDIEQPVDACGGCDRPEQGDSELPLITGLAAH